MASPRMRHKSDNFIEGQTAIKAPRPRGRFAKPRDWRQSAGLPNGEDGLAPSLGGRRFLFPAVTLGAEAL